MKIGQAKSSVVIEPYEMRRVTRKEDCRSNVSTAARTDISTRKWKVSESVSPIMSEFDRFSLNIRPDNSSTNRSCGSLNESFEKNLKFNLQNSFATSYSSESRKKKVSITAAPLIKDIPIIADTVEIINDTHILLNVDEEEEEDIDDVNLSSFGEDKDAEHSSNFYNYPEKVIDLEIEVPKEDTKLVQEIVSSLSKLNSEAKDGTKEKTLTKSAVNDTFYHPVDVDDSPTIHQEVLELDILENKPVIENTRLLSVISGCQTSKLCDVSKAYIMSQESSLISSPVELYNLPSALHLPGRPSFLNEKSVKENVPSPIEIITLTQSKHVEVKKKQPFFKSSFAERRLRELEQFDDHMKIILDQQTSVSKGQKRQPKSKEKPKSKVPKERKIKKNESNSKRKVNINKKSKIDTVCTIDSTKIQTKEIIIEDTPRDTFDYPIEKMRGKHIESDEDLFSFSPEILPKRKRKVAKKQPPKSNRKSNFSSIYDVNSEISSPSPIRLSYTYLRSAQEVNPNISGNDVIHRHSIKDLVEGFESDLEQMKTLHQSLIFQLDQFKEIAKTRYSWLQ